ncbi:MAG: sulfurtransferase, partial [Arenibacterium sp.]
KNPDALVSTEWLAANLDDPNLRIFDCSTVLKFEDGGKRPYRVLNCAEEHNAGHIPGAGYFDLQEDFSDDDSPFGMTLASPETVAAAFARAGVDDSKRVVLYSRRSISWATRFWWMLRWLGFDNAAVLDGGFDKWVAEDRPLSTNANSYSAGHLTIKLRPELFVDKDDILGAMDAPDTCLIDALGRDIFSGENTRYGRPGRIPGSISIPKVDLVNPETHAFRPAREIAKIFANTSAQSAAKHIAYCGGGIFATVDAFWLYQLGHENVAVYDNSMSEWGADKSLPMEVG